MKSKLLALLLLIVGVVGASIATATSGDAVKSVTVSGTADTFSDKNTISLETPAQVTTQQRADPPGTISGADDPRVIPDHVAFGALFRLLSDRNTELEQKRARAYLKNVGLGCLTCGAASAADDKEIDDLLAVAAEYQQRVSILDKQAATLKDKNWPDPSAEVMAELTELQRQKESLVEELVRSLPGRLKDKTMKKLRKHVDERMKKKIKMFPGMDVPLKGHDPGHQAASHH